MKHFLIGFLFVALASQLHAQQYFYGRPVRLGFKVDPVFSNSLKPFDNGVEKNGNGFGVNYGLMIDVAFRDSRGAFATGIEVVHATSKLSYASNGLYGPGDYKLKLQYVQFPISVKLKTNELYGFKWWGQFGTYLSPLIGARVDYSPSSGSGVANTNERILSNVNKANMGLLVGVGGEYSMGEKTDLFFGLGFENGFIDVTTNKNWNDGKVALNRWALRLGVFF